MDSRTTEQDSNHRNLEQKSTLELLNAINQEDKSVPLAIEKQIPQIENLVNAVYDKMKFGGRLFYIGSGTSGRLGILDASECLPTFGVKQGMVIGIIAGGDAAIRQAQEGAEDDMEAAWKDLQEHEITDKDFVVGISASGTTPYVLGGLASCRKNNIQTGCIVCNSESETAQLSDFPIEIVVGPEFLTGSTRMKAGTAQKLVLNMITTSVMIKLGRVKDNKMVDMQLSNKKLVDRGTRMLVNLYNWEYEFAKQKLLQLGSVRNVMQAEDSTK
ncbi:MAG: N-acetylmuramic acid 6-phosphate etherase [Sphingobacteriales bacterium]|nr:MAG: N-acetylmuramic acid 6-phosphate etherase [Sphingobacteriales bacterium]